MRHATCHGPSLMVAPSIEVATRIVHTQLTHTADTRAQASSYDLERENTHTHVHTHTLAYASHTVLDRPAELKSYSQTQGGAVCAAASPLRARGARVRVSGEAWAGTCHVPRREDGVGARWTRASRRRSTAAPAARLPVRTARLWLGTEPSQRLVGAPQQPSARSRCAVGSRP